MFCSDPAGKGCARADPRHRGLWQDEAEACRDPGEEPSAHERGYRGGEEGVKNSVPNLSRIFTLLLLHIDKYTYIYIYFYGLVPNPEGMDGRSQKQGESKT